MEIVGLYDTDSEDDSRLNPQPRVFRLRQYYELEDFGERFRLNREQFEHLLQTIGADLDPETQRSHALSAAEKLLAALRFYACGAFNYTIGDCQGPNKSSVCRAVHQVTATLNLRLFQDTIRWPDAVGDLANRFFRFAGMPSVSGMSILGVATKI
jgi:hypothetical protein